MKRIFAKVLMIVAIIAAIIAVLCWAGAFTLTAGVTEMFGVVVTSPMLTTVVTALASAAAPLALAGTALLAGTLAFGIDEEGAKDVINDATATVSSVVGAVGDVAGSIVSQSDKIFRAIPWYVYVGGAVFLLFFLKPNRTSGASLTLLTDNNSSNKEGTDATTDY